ncbi:hypothetical protein [Pararhodobacter sp. CCB-MM2]|uniref:hypothetical protein n=1 Tax=Pararhodobacter sp. CCB-MM2 TaxID=1786003 RepID=UPI001314DDD2|nr:hypothetical protein [Pararhodobacter sp. CCB-MM2]MCA2014361.1 hypothetical protein [Cereibacter sphaeroides]
MAHDWMRHTMEEMRSYARLHGLTALEEHLAQASLLLEVELANRPDPRVEEGIGPRH